jgi:hypothetical protein
MIVYKPTPINNDNYTLREVKAIDLSSGSWPATQNLEATDKFYNQRQTLHKPNGNNFPTNLNAVPYENRVRTILPKGNLKKPMLYSNYGYRSLVLDTSNLRETFKTIRKLNTVNFSGSYVVNTKINNLNFYETANEELLPSSLNGIQSLKLTTKQQESGTVMLAIGTHDSISIYVGEASFIDSQGAESILKSNSVIGGTNELKGAFGTQHKGSIFRYKRNVFFWDNSSGAYLRYDVNGLFPVSNYAAATLFNQLSDVSDYTRAAAGYNPKTREVSLALHKVDKNAVPSPTFGWTQIASTSGASGNTIPIINMTGYDQFDLLRVEVYVDGVDMTGIIATSATIKYGSFIVDEGLMEPYRVGVNATRVTDSSKECFVTQFVGFETFDNMSIFVDLDVSQTLQVKVYKTRLSPTDYVYGGAANYRFNSGENAWCGYDTYAPDCFGLIRQNMVSFKFSEMYIHDNDKAVMHGNPLSSEFSQYCKNAGGQGIVSPQSLGISADRSPDLSTAETKTSYTEMPSTEYRMYEDHFYTKVKRDVASTEGRLGGTKVRGKYVVVRHVYHGAFSVERFSTIFKSHSGHNV